MPLKIKVLNLDQMKLLYKTGFFKKMDFKEINI